MTIQIGNLTLKNRIIYSPLAGCSDYPFRQIAARFEPGLMYCEMVKMEPLIRLKPETYRMLEYAEEMRPIGGQICGSNPKLAREAAKIIEDLGFDVVDLNCGCPVDKVTKDGSGSGMLKNPELIEETISEMVAAVSIPVTVKIRAGWDENSINAAEVTRIAEKAGASAIFVHGRTRQQAYNGPANWDHITACKRAATKIKVIGNGDVLDADSALRMLSQTGCDGVLASRGTFGQPWIAEDIRRALEGLPPLKRDGDLFRQTLIDHFRFSSIYKEERGAVLDMRRVSCWYLKNVPGARELRGKTCRVQSLEEFRELIEAFSFEEMNEQ